MFENSVIWGLVLAFRARSTSRPLKKSGTIAYEACIVAVVDVEVSDEAACSAKENPATTGGRVVLIISLPRNYAHARAVAGAVSNIEEALQCTEGDFAVRGAFECQMRSPQQGSSTHHHADPSLCNRLRRLGRGGAPLAGAAAVDVSRKFS